MTAMTAATLDSLSGGRFRLGLGVSGPQVSEGWYGVQVRQAAGPHPRVRRDRPQGDVPRAAVATRASTGRCRCPAAPASRCKLTVHPVREHIPLYIAAIGPKNLEQTGEIADGALLIFPSAEHLEETALATIRAGREKAGLTLDGFDVCPTAADRGRRRRRRARRPLPPVHRALRRRHGQPQAELLQPARRGGWGTRRRPPRSRTSTWPATRTAPPRPSRASSSTPPACSGRSSGSPTACRRTRRPGSPR